MADKVREQDRNSKVIRVSKETLDKLNEFKSGTNGSWNSAIGQVLEQVNAPELWVTPCNIYKTKKTARKHAVIKGAAEGLDLDEIEQPVMVKALNG